MRQVNGLLFAELLDDEDPAPYVSVQVTYLDASESFVLLIDTGSDVTVLMPKEAYRLLGDGYFELDSDDVSTSMLIEGVGGNYRAIPFEMSLGIEDENLEQLHIGRRVWIAEPVPDLPSDSGNWALPSIFGRDAIRPGDFELSYTRETVTLFRPDYE